LQEKIVCHNIIQLLIVSHLFFCNFHDFLFLSFVFCVALDQLQLITDALGKPRDDELSAYPDSKAKQFVCSLFPRNRRLVSDWAMMYPFVRKEGQTKQK
jgi:hypothetical protein